MRSLWGILGLLAATGACPDQSPKQDRRRSGHHAEAEYVFGRDNGQQNVCYVLVTTITHVYEVATPAMGGVLIETPSGMEPEPFVTETIFWTGSEPTTVVIPPKANQPGTVIVEEPTTPMMSPEAYVTETVYYTGTSLITAPITETIAPHGEVPGTIIVEDPPMNIIPPPETTPTPTPTPTSPMTTSTTPTTSPAPTFSCDEGGYLIQKNTLYRLDLTTGDNPVVKEHVGPGGNINAMGYNVLDNYLYAFIGIANSKQQLIRIDANGDATLLPLQVPNGLNAGDVDNNGQLWATAGGSRWLQVDLTPNSDTYGQIVSQGKSTGALIADWVYLKEGGDYLYSIKVGTNAVGARWSRTSHDWETLTNYGPAADGHSGFGALYAVGDEVWGSDNQSGYIIAFPVLDPNAEYRFISDGPSTSSNDGARCFNAPPPPSPPQPLKAKF